VFALLATAVLANAQSKLPDGVIQPYVWGAKTIPIHGSGIHGTELIDFAVVDAMRKNGIVGCGVSICKDDTLIYCKGFGYAELPDKPFLPSTATRCGSIAKPITSLCALYLMDRGGLRLDEKVLPILATIGIVPRLVDERIRQITVRDLLDHTSGLPVGATYTSWRPERNLIEALKLNRKPTAKDVVLDALCGSRLEAEPGSHFQYANANFVILARVIEARCGKSFGEYLSNVVMPTFGVPSRSIFVSRDQVSPDDPARNPVEAAYYQTSAERFTSFMPGDAKQELTFGEAYRGYSSECADGAGGIAISALGIGKVLANLRSRQCAISRDAIKEILAPPAHYLLEKGFDRSRTGYYSKGFNVRFSGGVPWVSHGGMTLHCGGAIGYNAGYQFAALSNWNHSKSPFVDAILDHALGEAVGKLKSQ
jgi:CubicO group peptidase (beta-lactamase class C family)